MGDEEAAPYTAIATVLSSVIYHCNQMCGNQDYLGGWGGVLVADTGQIDYSDRSGIEVNPCSFVCACIL